jgi:MFS family permease
MSLREPGAKPPGSTFWKIAGAGAAFEAGSSAVNGATIIASLVFQLTGNVFAVGAASAVLRLGWLLPQIVVGFLAQHKTRRMHYYMFGAFGRAFCLALVAMLLWFGADLSATVVGGAFLALWTLYAFVSGVVAVPYNDIVGRSISSHLRSRMLAWRFFGGGLFALAVAAFIHRVLGTFPLLPAYALIFALASALMILSSILFVSAGEPPLKADPGKKPAENTLYNFLKAGWDTLQGDGRFRLFLYSQWLGGATLMAMPFYIVAASDLGLRASDVAVLLGAQTAGALVSNAFWGRIGDSHGKLRLLQVVGVVRFLPPLGILLLLGPGAGASLFAFAVLFVLIGVLVNGITIGYLGFLMEISPDDRRPAYSAYFNSLASPAALLPLLGAAFVQFVSIHVVFIAAIIAAALQQILLQRISKMEG